MTEPIPGWPQAEILHVSRYKVGDHPGCDQVEVTFTFDQSVYEWEIRANSVEREDGVFIARGQGLRRGFGRQRFGRTPFGRYEMLGTILTPTVTVDRDDLVHGTNRVTIYARARPDGPWV